MGNRVFRYDVKEALTCDPERKADSAGMKALTDKHLGEALLQSPPLLVVLLHPLRMKNLSEHRFDLPSATEPHIKFEQARVLGCEAAEHLDGGCDLVGL